MQAEKEASRLPEVGGGKHCTKVQRRNGDLTSMVEERMQKNPFLPSRKLTCSKTVLGGSPWKGRELNKVPGRTTVQHVCLFLSCYPSCPVFLQVKEIYGKGRRNRQERETIMRCECRQVGRGEKAGRVVRVAQFLTKMPKSGGPL